MNDCRKKIFYKIRKRGNMKKLLLLVLIIFIGAVAYSETEEYKTGLQYFYNRNTKEAEKYFKLAEEKEDTAAYRQLGRLYFYIKKLDLSEEYYKKAVEAGDDYSCYKLGKLYHIQKKYELSREYYQLGADRGDENSQYKIDILDGKVKVKVKVIIADEMEEELERNTILYENDRDAGV